MGEENSMLLLSEEFDADIDLPKLHELSQNSSKFCFVVTATSQSFTIVIEGVTFDLLYSNDKTTDVAFTLPDTESTTYHTMAEDFRKHTVITTFIVTFVLVSLMIVVLIIVIVVISKRKRQWPRSLSKQSSNTLYE